MSLLHLAYSAGPLALALAVVVVAFLVNRFAPKKRRRIRRTVILLVLYLASWGGAAALEALGVAGWAHTLQVVREIFAVFVLINVVGLLVFDIGLAALKVEISMLASDL